MEAIRAAVLVTGLWPLRKSHRRTWELYVLESAPIPPSHAKTVTVWPGFCHCTFGLSGASLPNHITSLSVLGEQPASGQKPSPIANLWTDGWSLIHCSPPQAVWAPLALLLWEVLSLLCSLVALSSVIVLSSVAAGACSA